jgi:hypothetical protein
MERSYAAVYTPSTLFDTAVSSTYGQGTSSRCSIKLQISRRDHVLAKRMGSGAFS